MIIGFTGTQRGMTTRQQRELRFRIKHLRVLEFHHGDCVGADQQAHAIIRELHPKAKVVVHPPINEAKRAFCAADEVLPPKEYLDRNHDIVAASQLMFATPLTRYEVARSGTWATIRHAWAKGTDIEVIKP